MSAWAGMWVGGGLWGGGTMWGWAGSGSGLDETRRCPSSSSSISSPSSSASPSSMNPTVTELWLPSPSPSSSLLSVPDTSASASMNERPVMAVRRDLLRAAMPGSLRFVFPVVSRGALMERVTRRSHAYFPPELLASQLAAFERPDAREPDCLLVDGERDLAALAEEVMAQLERR